VLGVLSVKVNDYVLASILYFRKRKVKMKSLFILVFTVVIIFAVSAPILLLSGVIVRDLWLWFIVPLGVPVIGLAQ